MAHSPPAPPSKDVEAADRHAAELFGQLDVDSSGKLTRSELVKALQSEDSETLRQALGLPPSLHAGDKTWTAAVSAVFWAIDTHHSQTIDLQEFVAYVHASAEEYATTRQQNELRYEELVSKIVSGETVTDQENIEAERLGEELGTAHSPQPPTGGAEADAEAENQASRYSPKSPVPYRRSFGFRLTGHLKDRLPHSGKGAAEDARPSAGEDDDEEPLSAGQRMRVLMFMLAASELFPEDSIPTVRQHHAHEIHS